MLVLEILLLALASSIDSLVAAFGYGSAGIRIPFFSALLMCGINAIILAASILIGYFLAGVISAAVSMWLSFGLLLAIGIYKFFSELLKLWLHKKMLQNSASDFKLFQFRLILCVIADSKHADVDKNKILSIPEAILLGLVFSVDGIGVGLSSGVSNPYCFLLIPFSIAFVLLSIPLGSFLGKKLAKVSKINLSWLSGLLLILLGVSKVFF